MSKALSRRAFLKSSAASLAASGFVGPFAKIALAENCTNAGKTIVQIDLNGGLASHMFMVPTSGAEQTSYLTHNPTLGLGRPNTGNNADTVPELQKPLPINGVNLGLHPALSEFQYLLNGYPADQPLQGTPHFKAAIVNKTGYPAPNGSHDLSRLIIETGVRDNNVGVPGWVGRIMDTYCQGRVLPVFSFAGNARELNSTSGLGVVLESVASFSGANASGETKLRNDAALALRRELALPANDSLRMINRTLGAVEDLQNLVGSANASYESLPVGISRAQYGDSGLARRLMEVAKVLHGGLNPIVCLVAQGGYDLHGNSEAGTTARLTELNNAISDFLLDLRMLGLQDKVIIVSKTDFGRNSFENGNTELVNGNPVPRPGHDHGAASLTFVIGTDVIPGVYGPGYTARDFENPRVVRGAPGVILPEIDFREVRARVLEKAGIDPAVVQTDAKVLPPVGLKLFA